MGPDAVLVVDCFRKGRRVGAGRGLAVAEHSDDDDMVVREGAGGEVEGGVYATGVVRLGSGPFEIPLFSCISVPLQLTSTVRGDEGLKEWWAILISSLSPAVKVKLGIM